MKSILVMVIVLMNALASPPAITTVEFNERSCVSESRIRYRSDGDQDAGKHSRDSALLRKGRMIRSLKCKRGRLAERHC
jgi:hypothetical protein